MNFDKEETFLIGLHEVGIDIWQLGKINQEMTFLHSDANPEMLLSKDRKYLFVKFGNDFYYKIETVSFKIIKKIALPTNLIAWEILENGDLNMAIKNNEFNHSEYLINKDKREKIENSIISYDGLIYESNLHPKIVGLNSIQILPGTQHSTDFNTKDGGQFNDENQIIEFDSGNNF